MVRLLSLIAAGTIGLSSTAFAQIKIGQTAGITGAVAASVKEATDGAKLYFDAVNAKGGIHGQQIQLISVDDKFDVQLAAANAKKLITEDGVIALFLNRGTPHTQAMIPVLTEYRVPLVGPSTGAMVLHKPVQPYIFNVRATYQREAEKTIGHLHTIGIDRVAIVQVDDAFGNDGATGALKGLENSNKKPVAHVKYDRTKPDYSVIIPQVVKENPQAVLFIGSGTAIVNGMKALRNAGSTAQMVTLSNNGSSGFVKDLGDIARGVVVSQVYPNERSIGVPIVKEAIELAKKKNMELTPVTLEGYVSAKVLVEGLRRAGDRPTRDSLKKGLESITSWDAGGLELGYSTSDHTGFDYADLSIIDQNGRFRR
jgi:ABC-type branched-subunit amino acid transport system substrate-binding protein